MPMRPSLQAVHAGVCYLDKVEKLKASFETGKTRAIEWRRNQLLALKRLLEENQHDLLAALKSDLGKCETEAVVSEQGFLLSDIDHTLKHLAKWMQVRKVSTPLVAWPGKSFQQPEPLGTVLIMGAWNYPLQLLLAPYVAALAAGNCAVLKPSELAEDTSALIARLIPQYMDTTCVEVVEGGKDESTALLACQWDHIFYTGGEAVGKIVMTAAARHLTPVTLELGGKSPCYVDKNTNLKTTARRLVWGKWMNAGQTCIAPDYVLVESGFEHKLIDAIKKELKSQYSKDPLNSRDYGNIINHRHFSRLQHYLEDVNVIYGGQVDPERPAMAPTLVLEPAENSALMSDEIFGPILPIITVASVDHAIRFINARPKPLALYAFSDDDNVLDHIIANTSSGSVCTNDTMLFMTNPELPFGGVGNSGMGQYHGQAGFDTFSHIKTVMKRGFALDVPFRYAPFSKLKLALLKRFL
ncbi:aldehyde dehydrogenase family protein [Alteromonas australica]|uniref:Aldehyde dehydrogenase n=2 Tax=Alteromonas australica TaxID=589873 RepID=A0A358E0B5_9ALTE|nr:aldehyde dehydrogenase family protein [Alteromonas australica]MBU33217.1 aldehyde dehydrogenase family protein [Alteromonas sp.]HAU26262.1 aldehyde dehydrogenase family protein [Alteromonas australica]HBU51613.1 aldehyde dehydrogenase family protein [Alteromonas australica]